MQFDVNGHPAEMPAFLNVLTEIAGVAAWRKREKDFARQVQENPLIERYLDSQFGIERSMAYVRHYRSNTGRVPWNLNTPSADLGALYSFAGMVARVFDGCLHPAKVLYGAR